MNKNEIGYKITESLFLSQNLREKLSDFEDRLPLCTKSRSSFNRLLSKIIYEVLYPDVICLKKCFCSKIQGFTIIVSWLIGAKNFHPLGEFTQQEKTGFNH